VSASCRHNQDDREATKHRRQRRMNDSSISMRTGTGCP
jgi:hypothetical protein